MTIGNRDTLISFQVKGAGAEDPIYGPQPGTWGAFSQAWAEVMDVLPSRAESVADGINLASQPARIRVDYLDGLNITSAMRIIIPANDYQPARTMRIISGPAFVRRSGEWELMTEQLSTAGEEP